MTKRTIKTGIGSYVDARGIPTYGFQGQEVDVHKDYLDDFDKNNVENGSGEPYEAERVGVDVVSPDTAADEKPARTSGKSTGTK